MEFKLFNYKGSPVTIDVWIILLFFIMSFNFALSIIISIIVHEMAHTFMADRFGYRVYGIKIGLFTGSASIDSNISQRDSIPITAAGPISNILLYLIGFMISFVLPFEFVKDFMEVNIYLAIFNLLPIQPMDGGFILKDVLMLKMRDRSKASVIANYISLISSIILLLLSSSFIMLLLSAIFIYHSIKLLGWIK